eukprot:g78539.t1
MEDLSTDKVYEVSHIEAMEMASGVRYDRTGLRYSPQGPDHGICCELHTQEDAEWSYELTQELNDHHTFLIQYEPGEDADLASHVDSSLITINVCLGKDFTGGQLYFHGLKGSTQSANDPYETPHPQAPEGCKHCIALYTHQPGFAVIHLGRQIHGANRITSGLRSNVVIWYRKQ